LPASRRAAFSRLIARIASAAASSARWDVFPGCVLEGKDREHTVAEEFEHLSAARAQRSGQRLEYLVEQYDDYRVDDVAAQGRDQGRAPRSRPR
jgi:hypothetical protein